jgi:hypothetical protein
MQGVILLTTLTLVSGFATARVMWDQNSFSVVPFDFDPNGTHLVEAEWEDGIGCPTTFPPPPSPQVTISDVTSALVINTTGEPACPTGDTRDKRNEGLFLAKTGPTSNFASAGAVVTGVQGITLNELGYDLRKPGTGAGLTTPGVDQNDPRGSHCGAGAPRFNIVLADDPNDTFFIGCNSPPPDSNLSGLGWQRLRWGNNGTTPVPLIAFGPSGATNISGRTVKRLSIVFDEGQDTGPDNFGFAVLDNIDINGTLVGKGPDQPEDNDRDEGQGEDSDHDNFQFHDSPSRPESSNVSYQDRASGMKVQSVNGARSVTYTGACVALITDALVNEEPGYLLTFTACNVPGPLGLGIGTLTVNVTGPAGFLYQKNSAITSGFVTIHPH